MTATTMKRLLVIAPPGSGKTHLSIVLPGLTDADYIPAIRNVYSYLNTNYGTEWYYDKMQRLVKRQMLQDLYFIPKGIVLSAEIDLIREDTIGKYAVHFLIPTITVLLANHKDRAAEGSKQYCITDPSTLHATRQDYIAEYLRLKTLFPGLPITLSEPKSRKEVVKIISYSLWN